MLFTCLASPRLIVSPFRLASSVSLCAHKKPTILCLAENIEFAFFPGNPTININSPIAAQPQHVKMGQRWAQFALCDSPGHLKAALRSRTLLWCSLAYATACSLSLSLAYSLNVTNTTHANNANERKCVNEPQNKSQESEWGRVTAAHVHVCVCVCVSS